LTVLRVSLVLVCGIALGCGRDLPPNLLLVSVDTLRADALGAYGAPLPTPTFDRLARDGVVFERAFAPTPATAASHATLFTGHEPQRHGLLRNGESLDEAATTLAERLAAAGWHTGAFVSSFVLDPRFGFAQGFAHYDATLPESGATMGKGKPYPGAFWAAERFGGFDRRATATTDAARRWIETAPEPFFAFVHYFDPHAPYLPPPVFAERADAATPSLVDRSVPGIEPDVLARLIRRYWGEVLYTDDALAALLDVAGRRERPTLVVVTADHGEGLGQHEWLEHAVHLYEEQLHVPLILHGAAGLAAGRRVATPVALADVAPTLLELLDVANADPLDGRSLAAVARGGPEPEARPLFGVRRLVSEDVAWDRGVELSVRDARWKYIWDSEAAAELYDLEGDPGELRDLAPNRADVAAELRARLEQHVAALPPLRDAAPLSDATREALRALGYVE
jgi:arylsulfatase A-like enzyme